MRSDKDVVKEIAQLIAGSEVHPGILSALGRLEDLPDARSSTSDLVRVWAEEATEETRRAARELIAQYRTASMSDIIDLKTSRPRR